MLGCRSQFSYFSNNVLCIFQYVDPTSTTTTPNESSAVTGIGKIHMYAALPSHAYNRSCCVFVFVFVCQNRMLNPELLWSGKQIILWAIQIKFDVNQYPMAHFLWISAYSSRPPHNTPSGGDNLCGLVLSNPVRLCPFMSIWLSECWTSQPPIKWPSERKAEHFIATMSTRSGCQFCNLARLPVKTAIE